MLFKKMFILATCLIAFLPVFSVEARDSDYGHIRGKTFYRNAGERVVSQTVDRVLDKVLGPSGQNGENQSFRAVVQSSMNVDAPYSLLSLNDILVRVVYPNPNGYRPDTYTGSIDIAHEIATGLSQYGVHCTSYDLAVAEAKQQATEANVSPDELGNYIEKYIAGKYPAELVAEVRNYNFREVNMDISMYDGRQNMRVMSYNGRVSVPNMGEDKKEIALKSIIHNFIGLYADK